MSLKLSSCLTETLPSAASYVPYSPESCIQSAKASVQYSHLLRNKHHLCTPLQYVQTPFQWIKHRIAERALTDHEAVI
eukprot:8164-Heterococcus_DN1.PRE.17